MAQSFTVHEMDTVYANDETDDESEETGAQGDVPAALDKKAWQHGGLSDPYAKPTAEQRKPGYRKYELTEERRAVLLKRWDGTTKTIRAMAEEFGVPWYTVRDWAQKLDIPNREQPTPAHEQQAEKRRTSAAAKPLESVNGPAAANGPAAGRLTTMTTLRVPAHIPVAPDPTPSPSPTAEPPRTEKIDAVLVSLLRLLPPDKRWNGAAHRETWLAAFVNTVDLLYATEGRAS